MINFLNMSLKKIVFFLMNQLQLKFLVVGKTFFIINISYLKIQ